jgi:hypothetical protein
MERKYNKYDADREGRSDLFQHQIGRAASNLGYTLLRYYQRHPPRSLAGSQTATCSSSARHSSPRASFSSYGSATPLVSA